MTPPVSYQPKSFFILFFKVGGQVVLIFLTWIAMFWLISEQALASAKQFANEGELASALVTHKYSEKRRDADGDRKLHYFLDLEYETQNGDVISLERLVRHFEYDRVESGDVFDILYLRSSPETIEVTIGSNLRLGEFFRKLAWLSVLLAIIASWMKVRRVRDAVSARKHRPREEVKLTEIRKKGWWLFGKGYQLVWRESTGREGRSLPQKAEKLMGFRSGDTLVVFRGDRRSWWVGDVGDRKAVNI